jgi:hypothetical protein
MTASYRHPVSIPEWTPFHRKLPEHSLCMSHVLHLGKRRCLAVPESEAQAYLEQLDRFEAVIAKIRGEHVKAELARPKPRSKGPKRVKPAFAPSRYHHHVPGSKCLTPISSTEPGWFQCNAKAGGAGGGSDGPFVTTSNGSVHEHRTPRGRPFLGRHTYGDADCPATKARIAAELREAELAAETHGEGAP